MDNSRTEYNPLELAHEVYHLLLGKGLPVERTSDLDGAAAGASQILRWLGLEPVIPDDLASYQQLDLDGQLAYNRRIHGD